MSEERTSIFIPRTSLRSPGFIGPVIVATALVVASIFTAPWDDDFSVIKIQDPTFVGFVGIWGACTRYNADNATTANPTATLTGNSTLDAMIHNSGKNRGCSRPGFGWTFSLPVNSTGLAGVPLPNSTIGFNVDQSENTSDQVWVEVMSKSQSHLLVTHVLAGIMATVGLLLLLIPYKPFEKTSPSLAKFIKTGSVSLILVALGAIASLVSFVLTLMTALKVRDTINQIGGGGGTHASLGNIFWFSIASFCLCVPSLWSTRGPM
ncbi:uncharacterized protein PGTG_06132 [Puccinia graminis f. sp. tritici CRL 75-36-700-3]|uniref:Uncharacterized protein n=1 Tax=Puccinia graminis f. sp. tritici (strain CRL 75-36-700-3 / race SCCL) TaxID=418459 RepID=E3K5Q8_PUCGT|nr:uncharacterized protein PGTG_06132 [Puccinia graminis f. sp. tritici CRL 75-36-700-3]EFP79811.2 hypothetical protein PGTG_06132 [Puccinia graminis f. sp. tritici CRL 75-36-700-3]